MILPDFKPAEDIFVARLAAIHIRMVAGLANVVEEKSFWLRRPDLNQRTWESPAHQAGALTVLRTLDRRSFQSDHLLAE
jgi:hypothetical protein